MARNFVAASSQYLLLVGAPVTAAPLSVSVWFNVNAVTTYLPCFSVSDGTDNNYRILYSRGDLAGDPLEWQVTAAGSTLSVVTSTSITAGVWNHALGVSASNTDHRVYLNGGGLGSSVTSKAPASHTRTAIGAFYGGSLGVLDGLVAQVGIWNVGLTAEDALILSKGFSPLFVKPENLVAYWPVMGRGSPEPDIVGGFNISLINTPLVADNPRIIYPTPPAFTRLTTQTVATPAISPNGGTFTEATEVTLTCATSGASIYYTIDGSTPDATDTLYTVPFTLSADATVKAIGIKALYTDSAVASAAFTITIAATGGAGLTGTTGITDITSIT